MRAIFAVALFLAPLTACGDRDVSDHPSFQETSNGERRESDIVRVETPVPPGKQVACEHLLDVEAIAAMLGEDLTIEDRNESKPDLTAVCGIRRAGKPPNRDAQKRQSEKTGILGVLPGDELCTVEAYCSTPSSVEGLVDRCEQRGDELNEDLETPACVHRTQRGPRWAYSYRVYDTETSCVYRVLGGPSVTDEDLVRRCTEAALTTIAPANLETYE